MKRQFSTSWKASKQPRKQRKYAAKAPLHTRHRFLNANLSKQLRAKYGKRSLPLRKGDEVLVMRGSFKKKRAKVVSIALDTLQVQLEGIQRTKKDGSKVGVKFAASSLQIQTLNLDDSKRFKKSLGETSKAESKKESTDKKAESETKTEKKETKSTIKEKK